MLSARLKPCALLICPAACRARSCLGENRQLLYPTCLSIACEYVDVELVPRSSGPADAGTYDDVRRTGAYRTGPCQADGLQSFSRRDKQWETALGKASRAGRFVQELLPCRLVNKVLGRVECRFLDALTLAHSGVWFLQDEQHCQLSNLKPPAFRKSSEQVQDSRDSWPPDGFSRLPHGSQFSASALAALHSSLSQGLLPFSRCVPGTLHVGISLPGLLPRSARLHGRRPPAHHQSPRHLRRPLRPPASGWRLPSPHHGLLHCGHAHMRSRGGGE